MSFLKKLPAQAVNSEFKLEVVPNPALELSEEKVSAQADMIDKIHNVSNGLFLPNPAVSVNGAIKSRQTYNRSIKVDYLASAMRKHNLVMRVSIAGEHTGCAMATPEHLENNSVIASPSGSFSLAIQNGYIRNVDFV